RTSCGMSSQAAGYSSLRDLGPRRCVRGPGSWWRSTHQDAYLPTRTSLLHHADGPAAVAGCARPGARNDPDDDAQCDRDTNTGIGYLPGRSALRRARAHRPPARPDCSRLRTRLPRLNDSSVLRHLGLEQTATDEVNGTRELEPRAARSRPSSLLATTIQ